MVVGGPHVRSGGIGGVLSSIWFVERPLLLMGMTRVMMR